ncbi:MAG: manganese transporter [Planctomycetaceae bacterium]|nr:manganese transporter [Planctomycetaceae bacterium]
MMYFLRLTVLVILLASTTLLSGCNAPATSSGVDKSHRTDAATPFEIVSTCGMVTDIVKQVAGSEATVIGIMNEGVDPHLYRPTSSDVKQLGEADVIFYSGLMLEGRMSDTFSQVQRTGIPVYAVTEGIDPKLLREPPEFAGHWDPHVWMDVQAWSACVSQIADALSEFDPAHKETYEKNAKSYQNELTKLDDYVRKTIASIPDDQRVLVTAHDAFGYFSRAYQIEVKSVQGLSTESDADLKHINELVEFICTRKIQAIFVESSVSDRNIKAILEGCGERGWEVKIGGSLFSDAMGAPNTYRGTYIGMMDHNASVIAGALGGQAAEKGLNGKL